jgi:hypothetical protein
MFLSQDEATKIASKLLSSFHSNHMVLFVGRDMKDNEIIDEIASLPWSCIVTSRTDEGFSSLFSTKDRTPREYCTFSEIPSRPLDRSKLPILRLFGIGKAEDDELASLGLQNTRNDPNAWDMLSVLPGMLDCINQMIVIGYQPDHPDEVSTEYVARKFLNIPDGNVQFFGMDACKSEIIQKLAEKKQFGYHQDSLNEILVTLPHKSDTQVLLGYGDLKTDNIFYSRGEAVSISDDDLHQTRHFVTLLTEQKLYAFRPMGRVQQAEWFSNFLKFSSTEGPQWYGYLKNSTFYLKREYEDRLVNLVEGLLEGAALPEKSNMPVILQGDPGSSKSVTLGALAYRIYEKHQYPILYIKDEYLTLSSGSEELEALNTLMSDIQKCGTKEKGAKDSKILLIWDCSAHRNVINNAKNLARELENWGRRFVLLCSSYSLPKYADESVEYYSLKVKSDGNKTGYECSPSDVNNFDFIINNKFFQIDAKRMMTEKEIVQLKMIFQSYSGIAGSILNSWWERLKEDAKGDIFQYFYKLISLIRPNLEEGLTKEQKKVTQYVLKQLERIEAGYETERKNNQVSLFEAAGFNPADFGLTKEDLEASGEEEEMFDLDRFNICVALFSRFKISTPYSLAMHMLCRTSNGKENVYSTTNRELFRVVTNEIPWIRYGGNDSSDDFTFSFRTSLEAEIFLEENKVSEEKQIDIICELIRLYGESYKANKYIDMNYAHNLQMLLRLIGPNTDYRNFQTGGKDNDSHKRILILFNRIIDQLQKLRTEYNVPDMDGSFANLEVTFMREYYGGKWDGIHGYERNVQRPWEFSEEIYSCESYEKRMQMLHAAVNIAVDKIEYLERRILNEGIISEKKHLCETRNALVVETVWCNLYAEDIQRDYLELCSIKKTEPEKSWSKMKFILPYRDIFKRMIQVINTDPTNGYAYNALFKLFLREYDRPSLGEKEKLQYLSEINMIIDMINSDDDMEIVNRGTNGKDELGDNMSRIKDLSGKFRMTINEIENRTTGNNPLYDLFDQMMEVNNPSAILFVCRQELESKKLLKIAEPLNKDQVECCIKVYDFMTKEENEKCIENNQFALSLLLRVAWMKFNKQPMFSAKECNLTYMNSKEWSLIERICSMYVQCAGENALPSIMLIYALATLQKTNDYAASNKILERINEGGFYSATRMRAPYMYCDENGAPIIFSGRVLSTSGYNGFIKVNGIPQNIGNNVGIRFNMRNLGKSVMPKASDVIQNLEIGIGYTGFSVYTTEGRQRKVEKQ